MTVNCWFLFPLLVLYVRCGLDCHCTNGCDQDFKCLQGGQCTRGWLGPTCHIKNIAFNKTTKQNGFYGHGKSSLAVDGVTSLSYWSKTCAHTDPSDPFAWWSVDLGDTYLVKNIMIYLTQDRRMHRLTTEVDGHLCSKLTPAHPRAPENITCNTPLYGRNVTVSIGPDDFYGRLPILAICEFEVLECNYGFYGPNCDRCGRCRGYETCNNKTGQCAEGCVAGWRGDTCQQECEVGSFGRNCSHKCGHCAVRCDPENGSCGQGGCMQGWIGQKCKREDFRKWTVNIAALGSVTVYDGHVSKSPNIIAGPTSVTTDGNTSLSSCVTISGIQPSWRIKFEQEQVIQGLVIEKPSSGRHFEQNVYVDGVICYTSYFLPQYTDQNVLPCYEPVPGRSVIITVPRGDVLSLKNLTLCEVQIYANVSNTATPGALVPRYVVPVIASAFGALVAGSVLVLVIITKKRKLGCFKPKGEERPSGQFNSGQSGNTYSSLNVQVRENEPQQLSHIYENFHRDEPSFTAVDLHQNEPTTACEQKHAYDNPSKLSEDIYEEVIEEIVGNN